MSTACNAAEAEIETFKKSLKKAGFSSRAQRHFAYQLMTLHEIIPDLLLPPEFFDVPRSLRILGRLNGTSNSPFSPRHKIHDILPFLETCNITLPKGVPAKIRNAKLSMPDKVVIVRCAEDFRIARGHYPRNEDGWTHLPPESIAWRTIRENLTKEGTTLKTLALSRPDDRLLPPPAFG